MSRGVKDPGKRVKTARGQAVIREGATTINFGDEPDGRPNFIPVPDGWNFLIRLYRPRPEALDGTRIGTESVTIQRTGNEWTNGGTEVCDDGHMAVSARSWRGR